jgi:hypothetical protein
MHIRDRIESIFLGKAFDRPLFYSYPLGVRFELSERGTAIEQFLQAMTKATEICRDIFTDRQMLVCWRIHHHADTTNRDYRDRVRALSQLQIKIPRERFIWTEEVAPADRWDDESDGAEWWVNLAFYLPIELIQNILWSPLAGDFASIRPQVGASVYLFDLERGLIVFPYDDRGMDVVGNDRQFLTHLYHKYDRYLLDYDREVMAKYFE